jgi:two-component system, sensor histidine kinase LadS
MSKPGAWIIKYVIGALLCSLPFLGSAQVPVVIDSDLAQHIIIYDEIAILKDSSGKLTLEQVASPEYAHQFAGSDISTPQIHDLSAAYWYRIRVQRNPAVNKPFIIEFFDQTLDSITAYVPPSEAGWKADSLRAYKIINLGAKSPFQNRLFGHKNFEITVDNIQPGTSTYYFRIKTTQPGDVIVVLRSIQFFIGYAVSEYFSFGLFYGMILIFSFYNLIMFAAMRQRQYLYYTLYNLSVGLYEACTDGIAYQYLWPNAPGWNHWAYSVPLTSMSICALLFTQALLHVKTRAPKLNRLISWVIIGRVVFFLACLFVDHYWFDYKFIEIVPLSLAFFTGVYIWRGGYRPARFFVVGYGFLFIGFMLKFFIMLGYTWLNFGVISYYSMSFCFIMEMFFLSFAIGDKVRLLRQRKEKAQQGMIRQMGINERLQRTHNQQLEGQVRTRTQQLTNANDQLQHQAEALTRANDQLQHQAEALTRANDQLQHQAEALTNANDQLQHQAEALQKQADALQEQAEELQAQAEVISRMNALLERDNDQLQSNVKRVSQARALSAPMDFEEFSKIYPDKEACYQFLSDLKWKEGYQCRKCEGESYFSGHQPYSRRCSKCGDEESVLAGTLFQNSHIPINKAFYMIFLIYSSKGKISSHKLSAIVDIRQSTCWSYLDKVKRLMDERKKELRQADEQGWSKLVVER